MQFRKNQSNTLLELSNDDSSLTNKANNYPHKQYPTDNAISDTSLFIKSNHKTRSEIVFTKHSCSKSKSYEQSEQNTIINRKSQPQNKELLRLHKGSGTKRKVTFLN